MLDKNENENLINLIATEISNLIPDCCGVTLGGSRAYGFEDQHSDVEMYFYSHRGAPSEKSLTKCLTKLNAEHKRHPSFLWKNKKPWGPHSFFTIKGLYFEIGYRNIDDVKNKILKYKNGKVEPQYDCHDLGLGYMFSGLSASVASEKPIILCNEELFALKSIAQEFTTNLKEALKLEYFDTAKSLLEGKLLMAANRADLFFYEVISGRITRCLTIMAFALGGKDFPGDKWNEQLLNKINWNNSEKFIDLLKKHISFKASVKSEFLIKRQFLLKAFELIKDEVEKF